MGDPVRECDGGSRWTARWARGGAARGAGHRGLVLGLPALVGTAALLVATRRGVYLSPDGLAYVGTARNLVDGNGFAPPPGSPPVANFPPLFPFVLAIVGATGIDPLTVARFLNPLLFGATILIIGLLVRRLTCSMPLALAAQLLVLSGGDFLAYHSAALSEPLFLLLALLALLLLGVSSERRRTGLLAAALLAGAACVTRYLGLAVVAGGAAAIGLRSRAQRRVGDALTFGAVALVPLAAWLVWLGRSEGRIANRTAVFHAPGLSYVARGLGTASTWVLPAGVPWPARAAVTGAAAALIAAAGRARQSARRHRLPPRSATEAGSGRAGLVGVAAFSLAYLLALIVDRALFDATGRLDARFLLPLHAAVVVLGAWAVGALDLPGAPLARLVLGTVVAFQLASGALWVYHASTDAAVRPGGFAAPRWVHSRVIDQVRALAPTTPVWTNDVGALFFHTGRVAAPLPERAVLLTGRANPAYDAEMGALAEGLRRGGLLVYLTASPARRVFLPTPAEVAGRLRLSELTRDEVALLYGVPGALPVSP